LKKILILILLVSSLFSNTYETRLYEKIIPDIFQKHVVVYTDVESREFFNNKNLFSITNDCLKADIIVGKKFTIITKECMEKPFFTTSYRAYRKYKNSIGAFYWSKGRPQLIFSLDKIDEFNLILPENLKRYGR